jgi:hypothetical protein
MAGALASVVFSVLKTITLARGTLTSARKLHDEMLNGLFYAPSSFFDTTPVGMNILLTITNTNTLY